MSLIATALKHMLASGMAHDAIVAAIEEMEACLPTEKPRSSAADRMARYRDRMDVSETEWQQLRWQVFERDKFTCQYCYAANLSAPHCDHVTPLILGGRSVLENLVCACAACNCGKSGRTPEQWRAQ